MRDKIVEAMYHLIGEYGYDKASLSKLCERVGITKPSIYYYFPSKEAILQAVFDALYVNPENDKEINDIESEEDLFNFLHQLGSDSIDGFHDDEERLKVLAELDLQVTRVPSFAEHRSSLSKKTSDSYAAILQHGKDIGALSADLDVDAVSQLFYVLLSGMSVTVSNKDNIDEKAVWNWLVDNLLITQGESENATKRR